MGGHLPVNVSGHICVHLVVEHKLFPSVPHVYLIARDLGRVHRSVGHGEYPGSDAAIDRFEIVLHPLILLVILVDLRLTYQHQQQSARRKREGVPTKREIAHLVRPVDVPEWSRVSDVGLLFGWHRFVARQVGNEGVFG